MEIICHVTRSTISSLSIDLPHHRGDMMVFLLGPTMTGSMVNKLALIQMLFRGISSKDPVVQIRALIETPDLKMGIWDKISRMGIKVLDKIKMGINRGLKMGINLKTVINNVRALREIFSVRALREITISNKIGNVLLFSQEIMIDLEVSQGRMIL